MTQIRFIVGGRPLCVDRGALRTHLLVPVLSLVPDAPHWLLGAYNHLGRAVAVLDVAALLGVATCVRPPPCVLLVDAPSGLLGIACDGPPEEVRPPSKPRRGALLEVVDRGMDLLRVDLPLLELRIEAELGG